MRPDPRIDRHAMLRVAIFAASAAALATPAVAQTNSSATSRARVLQPVSLNIAQSIDFGTIIPSTARASTVRVNLNGTVTPGGGAVMVGAAHRFSQLTGQGTRNAVILITRPGTVWLTGPGPRMRARSWTLGTTTGLTRVTGNQYRITGTGGNFSFRLGATLDVARNQTEGEYQGSYPVTVNYQ
jgi:hypothetical protein